MRIIEEMLEQAPFLRLDANQTVSHLSNKLKQAIKAAGFDKAIVGLSGGIDSALTLYLSVHALGKDNVVAVKMPYKHSSPSSLEDAQKAIDALGVESLTVDITPQIDAYFKRFPDATALRKGNKMARERMSILYDLSAQHDALVIGTGNKSEMFLGYGTQFGDLACAINPVADLYKTQVRQLSAHLGIPESIITKAPSADLWQDQTDEGELGYTYLEADVLLHYMVDRRFTRAELIQQGFAPEFIDSVIRRIQQNHFKRHLPVTFPISERSMTIDYEYLRGLGL
ncbi:NAD+ synthase [Mechercharimyces sp. CAU 1602]|uniref:NAD+ synthase n=1 Tax=Mechercharimyces sp. CAU 1602 TaxID=2973933 RepID=UPI00216233E1|nr:NAD+ synthase [Mechercharimyces sp. CAU 1602]MCS1351422.1 NAD+ synthase [Mechercharimyces sp. CAU 1602]